MVTKKPRTSGRPTRHTHKPVKEKLYSQYSEVVANYRRNLVTVTKYSKSGYGLHFGFLQVVATTFFGGQKGDIGNFLIAVQMVRKYDQKENQKKAKVPQVLSLSIYPYGNPEDQVLSLVNKIKLSPEQSAWLAAAGRELIKVNKKYERAVTARLEGCPESQMQNVIFASVIEFFSPFMKALAEVLEGNESYYDCELTESMYNPRKQVVSATLIVDEEFDEESEDEDDDQFDPESDEDEEDEDEDEDEDEESEDEDEDEESEDEDEDDEEDEEEDEEEEQPRPKKKKFKRFSA